MVIRKHGLFMERWTVKPIRLFLCLVLVIASGVVKRADAISVGKRSTLVTSSGEDKSVSMSISDLSHSEVKDGVQIDGIHRLENELRPEDRYEDTNKTEINKDKHNQRRKRDLGVQANNENFPKFDPFQDPIVVKENIPVGTFLLNVTATLPATGSKDGATIAYTISDSQNFSIGANGTITSNARLDYESNGGVYDLNVTATNTVSGTTSIASVRIKTENTNDESPIFSKPVYDSTVDENAKPNAIVATVLAVDRDGDKMTYSLTSTDSDYTSESLDAMFVIDDGGVIRLGPTQQNFQRDVYELIVTATDDGKCCPDGQVQLHNASAIVRVTIVDVNDNKPTFADCATYEPSVKENSPFGTPVIKVVATDKDRGANGRVSYKYIPKSLDEEYFLVNPDTGEVTTKMPFDREKGKTIPITVIARDHGIPPLEDICVFKVIIDDANDNPPRFDRNEYRETVKQDAVLGARLFRLSATDSDADSNAHVLYSLRAAAGVPSDDAVSYFSVTADSGMVSLAKNIGTQKSFAFEAVATDGGTPPLSAVVQVIINVGRGDANPPIWEFPEYSVSIKENFTQDSVVSSVRAKSGISDPRLTYSIISGSTESTNGKHTFRIIPPQQDDGYASIELIRPLDFEEIQKYTITMRAQNFAIPNQVASETVLIVNVEDVNDESPEFEATKESSLSVMEGAAIGTLVGKLPATDRDTKPDFKNISYSLSGSANDQFRIDQYTGEIYTKVVFDREQTEILQIRVNITDGAPSARSNIKGGEHNSYVQDFSVLVGDANDNNPEFERTEYNVTIPENMDTGKSILALTATDKDQSSTIRYEISEGNADGKFTIKADTGILYVTGDLDYETPPNHYTLTVVASDGLHENSTKVNIVIEDVNDNPPKFTQNAYSATLWERKWDNITGLPQFLLKVEAEDTDSTHSQKILYFLTGQANDKGRHGQEVFFINNVTGEIYVNETLDRDQPYGRPVWQFNVLARDQGGEGLDSYAQVTVTLKDINDNAPSFNQGPYTGEVLENEPAGKNVMTMTAIDYDDQKEGSNAQLIYSIIKNAVDSQDQPIFAIDSSTAIVTTLVGNLDREVQDRYEIIVQAQDGGGLTGTGTATITIKDANDNPPHFDQSEYWLSIPETDGVHLPPSPILVMHVSDADLPETNSNFFSIVSDSGPGWDRFRVVPAANNTVNMFVVKELNYENEVDRAGFSFEVRVNDGGTAPIGSGHEATCRVNITIHDINDNAPTFDVTQKTATISEDAPPGTVVETFHATDVDSAGSSVISYAISRESDHNRLFLIESSGTVKVNQFLDREKTELHILSILAIDNGLPPRTSTATLTVNVLDVNDNAPELLQDYRPVVPENMDPVLNVVEVFAKDADSEANGPPFKFWLDDAASVNIRNSFNVEPNSAGRGSAKITTKVRFDREEQKTYLLPIVIQDNGTPSLSSTSTLTVTIGDENDNDMGPGSVSIFVYNYEGKFPDTPIGRVYVDDKDDWDIPDKTFSWDDDVTHPNFTMNGDNGTIIMLSGTKEGTYVLRFSVYDQKFGSTVLSNATVTVKNIPEIAVRSSGSIRMADISEEEFISNWDFKDNRPIKSKYMKMKETIASIVKADIKNVDLFTVKKKRNSKNKILDIRFSAHGSPYYQPEKLNEYLLAGRSQIESDVGVSVVLIGVNECLYEQVNCEGSCTNELRISDSPYIVNANRSCLAGVGAEVVAECTCRARNFSERETCATVNCYNGGVCDTFPNGAVRCSCPRGYDGPRCQQMSIGFQDPGFAWFPAFQQCVDSHLSLEFITKNSDGLIFYNGPTTDPVPGEQVVQDFISLELFNGYPRLLLDFGSGTLELTLANRVLNDEEWHRIDVFWSPDESRLLVDYGELVGKDSHDRTCCEAKGTPNSPNQYLNLNNPLQVGGINHSSKLEGYTWRYRPTQVPFIGCIKNLALNGEFYDLASPAKEWNALEGCPLTEAKCHDISPNPFCVNGTCVASKSKITCECRPGYGGDRCDEVALESTLDIDSYIRYSMKHTPDSFASDILLRFRTEQTSGELFRAVGHNQHIILEVQDDHLVYRHDLNSHIFEERVLSLDHVAVSDGLWHSVAVSRKGSCATLSLDGGEGRRFNETLEYQGLSQQFENVEGIYAGGFWNLTNVINDFYDSCLGDIRFEHKRSPLPQPPTSSQNNFADVIEQKNIRSFCPQTATCENSICPFDMLCTSMQGFPVCRCPIGYRLTRRDVCEDINECDMFPCKNGGSCENIIGGFFCKCPQQYSGLLCDSMYEKAENEVALSTSSMAVIILVILIILILIAALIVYTRKRRTIYKKIDTEEEANGNLRRDNGEDGEDDTDDIRMNLLKVPERGDSLPNTTSGAVPPGPPKPNRAEMQGQADVDAPFIGKLINDQMDKADADPDGLSPDTLLTFLNEGGGSSAGSLSSLASSGMEDYQIPSELLAKLGPRFRKLADMYGEGQESDSESEFV